MIIMRYTFSLILALALIQVNSQSKKFKFTEDNPSLTNQFVVIEKDSMPISEGYSKMIEFIKMNYSSEKAIKSKIVNKYIKIGANQILDVPYEDKTLPFDADYVLEFRFKPNKIQMKIVSINRTTTLGTIPADNLKEARNDLWENFISMLPDYFNNLSVSIKSSIEGNDDW